MENPFHFSPEELEKKAIEVRKDIIAMLLAAGSGHAAGSLSIADVMVALYFNVLRYDPRNPMSPDRDRLVQSNGHECPARYAAMAQAGFFPREELKTLRKLGSRLQGHPSYLEIPALESSSGPVAQGLSIACGMAEAASYNKGSHHIFCLTGDGGHNEGQMWEAVMFAGARRLSNLTEIIDRNNIQIDGFTEDVMPLEPLRAKYEAFRWKVIEIDGHNMAEIVNALEESKHIQEAPVLVVANTVAGKGVDFIENKFEWHGRVPNKEEAKIALAELRTLGGRIESEHE